MCHPRVLIAALLLLFLVIGPGPVMANRPVKDSAASEYIDSCLVVNNLFTAQCTSTKKRAECFYSCYFEKGYKKGGDCNLDGEYVGCHCFTC